MRALVIGDLAIDVVAAVTRPIMHGRETIVDDPVISEAGVGGNIAWYLSQLGLEAHVAATVGADQWGSKLKRGLQKAGIRTGLVRVSRKPTSVFFVLVDARGEKTMIGSRSASMETTVKTSEILRVRPRWIHVSGYSLLNKRYRETLRAVRKASDELGARLSTDLEAISAAGRRIDLDGMTVFCNMEEFHDYFESDLHRIARRLSSPLVVKAGKHGCYLLQDAKVTHFPSLSKRVVDTTGAGDAFNAGFIASILKGNDERTACKWANAVAALKVRYHLAKARLPRRELAALLFRQSP
jgi:ribokinase